MRGVDMNVDSQTAQTNLATFQTSNLPTLKTWPLNWALIRYRPWSFAVHSVLQILFIIAPVGLGLVEQAVFDTITGSAPAALGVWALVALYISIGLAQLAFSFGSVWGDVTFRYGVGGLLRHNMFASLLRRPGALPPPVSSGEAISRYRDDVGEISDFPTWLPNVAGEVIAFIFAVAIMAQINSIITLVIFLPLFAVIGIVRLVWARFMRAQEEERAATDAVTGFLGELFGAVQAVKVAGAEDHAIERFAHLNHRRRRAAINFQVVRCILLIRRYCSCSWHWRGAAAGRPRDGCRLLQCRRLRAVRLLPGVPPPAAIDDRRLHRRFQSAGGRDPAVGRAAAGRAGECAGSDKRPGTNDQ